MNKKAGLAFLAILSGLLIGCSYSTESVPVGVFYTIRYFDDAETPVECGYSYFMVGQTPTFKAEKDAYGSVYNYKSLKTPDVGHYFAFDGWYFKNADGSYADKADLTNISQEYIDSFGISTASSSVAPSPKKHDAHFEESSSAESSAVESSLPESSLSEESSVASEESSTPSSNYSIADKELKVYAHFTDRRISFTLQYMDGVDLGRTPASKGNRLITQTVTFGAGVADEKISGTAYYCPHCHKIVYDDKLSDASSSSSSSSAAVIKKCPKCLTEMEVKTDFDVPMYSILSRADFTSESEDSLDGHPDYGYLSNYQGWALQKDFEDLDADGNSDKDYTPGIFTSGIEAGASFRGDTDASVAETVTMTGTYAGDLYIDRHIDAVASSATYNTQITELFCWVKGAVRGTTTGINKWVNIGKISETQDPTVVFAAHYLNVKDDFSLKVFDSKLADEVTEANAVAETTHYRGDPYTITQPFRKMIEIDVTGFGGDVVSSALVYDTVDSTTQLPVDPVAITGYPSDLFADTSLIDKVDLQGYYYGDETIIPQYRARPIVVKTTRDSAANKVSFLVNSLDGPGYLYPTVIA